MLFNRHFFIIGFSVLFIGMIFWWQSPQTTVSAMAGGEYTSSPYSIVKNYWEKMDYRQFELALEMTALPAGEDHTAIEKLLTNNPFLSIQKTNIEGTPEENTFLVKITLGSVMDQKQEVDYLVRVERAQKGWLITSLKAIT